MSSNPTSISSVLNRNLVFIHGKGGVGKTAVSHALSLSLAKNQNTLWVTIEDPTLPAEPIRQLGPRLWHLNSEFTPAFEEYASLKIGVSHLTRLFLKNKVIRYLAHAAPGIHDLVLLGKIWSERTQYSHVVVDMPSTGYGLAFFQSAENFSKLFRGGPLHRDAEAMLETFRDPYSSGHLIVALPEEMPLRESIELNEFLLHLFPKNPAAFLINRVFPAGPKGLNEWSEEIDPDFSAPPQSWKSPFAKSATDYVLKRAELENFNKRIWQDLGISFGELPYLPPPSADDPFALSHLLAEQLRNKAYV